MNIEKLYENLEIIAEEVHNSWWKEKKNQGFHAPEDCWNFDKQIHSKFSKQCATCHPDMYPYAELSENIKEYDRVTVRTVLNAISKL
jgi:transcription initiation factor IIE alpha subunit